MDRRTPTDRHAERALESRESLKVAQVVRELPRAEVTMAWRSRLSERLLSARRRQRSRRLWLRTGLASTGFVAAGFLILLIGPRDTAGVQSGGAPLEAAMVAAHRENVRFTDLAGPGLALPDAGVDSRAGAGRVQWKEADLELL